MFENSINIATVAISITASAIVSVLTINLESFSEKRKRRNTLKYETLRLIKENVQNVRSITPHVKNQLIYNSFLKKTKVKKLSEFIDEYNRSILGYSHILQANLIDMFYRNYDPSEEENLFEKDSNGEPDLSLDGFKDPYLPHHFSEEENIYLNKMTYYLCHENYNDWIETDIETRNYFKRKMWSKSSDVFEFYGLNIMMTAFVNPKVLEGNPGFEVFQLEEGIEDRIKLRESTKKILNVVNKDIKAFL